MEKTERLSTAHRQIFTTCRGKLESRDHERYRQRAEPARPLAVLVPAKPVELAAAQAKVAAATIHVPQAARRATRYRVRTGPGISAVEILGAVGDTWKSHTVSTHPGQCECLLHPSAGLLHASKVNCSHPCRGQTKRVTEGSKRAGCPPIGCPARCKRRVCIGDRKMWWLSPRRA